MVEHFKSFALGTLREKWLLLRAHGDKSYSCKDVACVVLLPSVLLSLVLIGVCSLFIYLHLLQEYHAEIDKLKSELQAARDKDGVFLPKEHYEEQLRAKEVADKEIQEKTLLLKAMEEELEKFKVRIVKMGVA